MIGPLVICVGDTVKTTQYFRAMRTRQDRAVICDEWIERGIHHPIHEQVQADGRIRRWAKIEEMNLPMKLLQAEYAFGGSKLLFYFFAENRVDFRDLVKDLAKEFKIRIEMRQVGVRDEAKIIGGLGNCGNVVCCKRFLNNFSIVSIKMMKEQSLALNPAKISGVCGRLMCCLSYEHDMYLQLKKNFPKVGKRVKTPQGEGKVLKHNALTATVTVLLDEGKEATIPVKDIIHGQGPTSQT